MTKEDALTRFLSLNDCKQVSLWNDYCDDSHNWDKELSVNDAVFFEDNFYSQGMGIMEILEAVENGNYHSTDKFATITEDDILVSAEDMMTIIDFMDVQDEFSEWLLNKGV